MSASGSSEGNRSASRRRVLKSGVIAYHDQYVTRSCFVRDLSRGGARLEVAGSIDVPDTFQLLIELDGTAASCQVMWRRNGELGVKFVQPPKSVERRA